MGRGQQILELFRKPENAAVLLGLLYVILEGPYVGILPALPIAKLFSCLLGIGIFARAIDRFGIPTRESRIHLTRTRSFLPGIRLSGFRIIENEWGIRDVLTIGVLMLLPTLYWKYSTKFLGMNAKYLASMSTDIPCTTGVNCIIGAQMNLSYYPMGRMILVFGGLILMCFLLVQNEFGNIGRAISEIRSRTWPWSASSSTEEPEETMDENTKKTKGDRIDPITGIKVGEYYEDDPSESQGLESHPEPAPKVASSLFAIIVFVACMSMVPDMELSASTQSPFLFLGGGVVAGILLLQNNLGDIFSIRRHNLSEFTDGSAKSISAAISLLTILLFVGLFLNLSFIPIISQDIPSFLSLVTMLVVTCWIAILSREGSSPGIQSHRTAAFAFLLIFPFLMYLLLRVVFLQNDGTNPVMLNRWALNFDFMDNGNTFKINPWPLAAAPNLDSRWVFLKAAVINSVRATLVSIFLCTILGIIIGVARLSTNRLTAWAATVYVEIFRNLPLAVLLFLLATQIGLQFPMFIEEKSLFNESVYYSNEGIWFATFASASAVGTAVLGLAILRAFLRQSDRVEPRVIAESEGILGRFSRPFSPLGWRMEPLAADLLVLAAIVILVTRVQIGEALFLTPAGGFSSGLISHSMFEALFSPFITTGDTTFGWVVQEEVIGEDGSILVAGGGMVWERGGGNLQSFGYNAKAALGPLLGVLFVIYALLVSTKVDDDGMNAIEVDDSEEGVRKRFAIWVAAVAVAFGFALSAGISKPEFSKDIKGEGIIASPGAWDIVSGTGFEITPFFLAMVMGLTLFTASVVAEIVRGSIQSLPRGQVEAAISLSLNPFQRLRLVILPQALRSMIPLLNNQFMNVWKNSSLAVVVAYTDIFYVILVMMNNVGRLIPLFVLLLVTYQAGSLAISAAMNWYNSRVTSVKI